MRWNGTIPGDDPKCRAHWLQETQETVIVLGCTYERQTLAGLPSTGQGELQTSSEQLTAVNIDPEFVVYQALCHILHIRVV